MSSVNGISIKKCNVNDIKTKKILVNGTVAYVAEVLVSYPSGVYTSDATGSGWSRTTYGPFFDLTDYDFLEVTWHGDNYGSGNAYARTSLRLLNDKGNVAKSASANNNNSSSSKTTWNVSALSGMHRLSLYGEAQGGGVPCWAEINSAKLYC